VHATLLIKNDLRLHVLSGEMGSWSDGKDSFQGGKGSRERRDEGKCDKSVVESEAEVGDGVRGADQDIDLGLEGFRREGAPEDLVNELNDLLLTFALVAY
jgi:hypothetical protein